MQDRVVHGELPYSLLSGTIDDRRQTHLPLAKPKQYLTHASQLRHLGKHQLERLLHSAIWIHFDLAGRSPTEANRKAKLQFAAFGFLADRFE